MGLEAHVEEYLSWLLEQGRSKRTTHQYHHKLGMLLTWLDGRLPTVPLLREYRIHRQETGRRPRTVGGDLAAAYGFFKWLEGEGHAGPLPRTGSVERPRMDEAQRARFTDAEVERIFAVALAMPAHTERKQYLRGRALCILAVLAGAGLRRGELLALNVADIRRDMEPWRVQIRLGKGAQSGMVPIGDETRDHLSDWFAIRHRWCYRHRHHTDALLPVDKERRLAERGLMTIWDELMETAGLTGRGFTPHCLRHWYGTHAAASVDLPTAQKLLRHKRLETTFQYLGTDQGKMQEAAAAISFRVRSPETGPRNGSSGAAPTPDARTRTRHAPGRRGRVG